MYGEQIIAGVWWIGLLIQYRYWLLPGLNLRRAFAHTPDISVVICVRGELELLRRLMACLQSQTYRNYEVVVVNDGPDLSITRYLHDLRWERLRVIVFDAKQKKIPGKKLPLATGIQAAGHDWVLLTDADCMPGPHWIETMARYIQDDNQIVLGYAPLRPRPGFLSLLQRMDTCTIGVQYLGAALRGRPYMGVGRNLMYRKSLFSDVRGFDSHAHLMSGDDDLFIQSAGSADTVTICPDPSAFVYSDSPPTWHAWLRQKRRHLSASRAYRMRARVQTTLFALSWLLTWLLIPSACSIGTAMTITVTVALLFFWILFGNACFRLKETALIPWLPILGICYCLLICTFAILMILRPPRTWNIS